MEIVTLGTGSPLPDPDRAGPSTLVRAGGLQLLVDCGRGVLMRAAAAGLAPQTISHLLLTHLHSDHTTDLNDVITTRWITSMAPNPLPVVGPAGTRELVERTLDMLREDIGYRRDHHADLDWEPSCEVLEVSDGDQLDLGNGVRLSVAATDHRPVRPTVGYRVDGPDGSAVLAGDTIPCPGLDRLCEGADIYVQTVVRDSLIRPIPLPRLQDILDYHSTVTDAARTAARAGVGTLVLTHPVPAPAPGSEGEWEAEAAEHFGGRVVLAADLTVVRP
jgi:ribonuclease Z